MSEELKGTNWPNPERPGWPPNPDKDGLPEAWNTHAGEKA